MYRLIQNNTNAQSRMSQYMEQKITIGAERLALRKEEILLSLK